MSSLDKGSTPSIGLGSLASDKSEFLNYELPEMDSQYPACFCVEEGVCPKHNTSAPSLPEIVSLVEK